MGRTVPTKQMKKYKNSRRKAKGTVNRQRNSWIWERGYTSCCADPGFVSQIGVHLVSERGWRVDLWRQLHWTPHHAEPLVENTCISLRSHVCQGSVSSSFSSAFFLVGLMGPGYLQNMYDIWYSFSLSCVFVHRSHVLSIPVWVFPGPTTSVL